MHHDQTVMDKDCCHHHGHFCWSAIIAGALVGMGLGFLLHLYSLAIGLTAFTATQGAAATITMGGLIGLIIGTFVAMGIAGFTAGFVGHCWSHGSALLYGFATWSLALILTALLALPLQQYVTAYSSSLGPQVVSVQTDNSGEAKNVTVKAPEKNMAKTMTTDTIAWGSWVLFGLFFIGAFASCLGAYMAVSCHRKHCHTHPEIH